MVFEMCKRSLTEEVNLKGAIGKEQVKIWIGQTAQALCMLLIFAIHPSSILIRGWETAVLTRFRCVQKYYEATTITKA